MGTLVYVRLIGYTAGTLLMLFWIVVIVGYRRQRNFERVFFFLCLALFLFYGGSLLGLNAQIYYAQPPPLLTMFSWTVLSAGLCFAPALLIHLHLEYASTRSLMRPAGLNRAKRLVLMLCYALVTVFAVSVYRRLTAVETFEFLVPVDSFGRAFAVFLGATLLSSGAWQFRFGQMAGNRNERRFH